MYTVTWFWNDGTMGQYIVETKAQAEMMVRQLYFNPDIATASYGDI